MNRLLTIAEQTKSEREVILTLMIITFNVHTNIDINTGTINEK